MILVLTYAKVCTTSLHHFLVGRFPDEAMRSHGLRRWILDPLETFAASATADVTGLRNSFDDGSILARIEREREAGEPLTLISGVRDPIARSLSVAIQNLEAAFADCVGATPEATAEALAARVAALWQRETPEADGAETFMWQMIRAPLLWFQEEIETPFGFDLLAEPFDRARGYALLANDKARLLLFRHENAPEAIERGLAELFPGLEVSLPHENDNTTKATGAVYAALKKCFRLPRATLEAIYAHPYVGAFYSEADAAAAIDRWAQPRPVEPAVPRPGFAATVFIPVRNHAEWIGQHLDSLFAQWRPDTELVLVDDGSSDGSFNVALDRLSGHPEVAATVMRNSTSTGHGMLPDVVALSRAPVLIQADSDDIALPGRLDTIIGHFAAHADCRLLTTNAVNLNEAGIPIGLYDTKKPDERLTDPISLVDRLSEPFWLGAASAYHRSVLEAFPPIDPELCPYGLDLLTGLRAVLLGSQHYISRPLVGYRQHSRNSHRVSGWKGTDLASREHSEALNMMVRAQRLRDIVWARDRNWLEPSLATAILGRWQEDFIRRADTWIRFRNGLTGTHAATLPPAADGPVRSQPSYIPPVPPIVTLPRGRACPVSEIGPALARWSGFYHHEGNWIWTARHAVVVLRIPDRGARELIVKLAGLAQLDLQRVSLSLDFGEPVETPLTSNQPTEIRLPIAERDDRRGDTVTLLIHALCAVVPTTFVPTSRDTRVLGVALFSLLAL